MLDVLRARLGGSYRIDRELGGGGMSRVFLAEELALGRFVVLKVLPPELAGVLSAARFEREVKLAARLQHPHIVPLLAAGQAGDALFYTMPWVEGESLRARLDRQHELPVAEAASLLREVADALAYAHRAGVVHRDIKPDNILLSHGHAMVTDFGIARAVSEAVGTETLTQTGMAVGTPAYMSPEQASGESAIDHRADIYALGVVAYEMLAGMPPFRASTFQALVAAHLTQTPPPLAVARPSVPPELGRVVHRALQKRAADRYQDAGEMVTALTRAAGAGESELYGERDERDEGETVAPAGAREEPAAPSGVSRRTALLGAATLGVAGLAFGSGAFVARRAARGETPAYHRLTFRRGLIRTARFGPDFQTVLYGAQWDGDVCRVYSVRPESPESAPLTLPPATPLAVSPSGEIALALGDHARGVMPYGTLARVPMAGGAPRELQEEVKYADWTPDGRELAIVRRVGSSERIEFPAGTVFAEPADDFGGFSFVRVSPRGDAIAAFELTAPDSLYGRVVVFDRSGTRRTSSARFFNVFGLSWRGDEVWFTAADALPLYRNTVYALNTSGRVRIIARVPGNTSLHDISPDGRALIARTDDRSGISVRVPGETVERDLSWLDASVLAAISPDGRQILFTEAGVGGGSARSTYLRGTDGSAAVRLGAGMARALSPDGKWAITDGEEGSGRLMVIPTGAGEPFPLARAGLRLLDARWLGSEEHVLVRAREGNSPARLFALALRGSSTMALTPEGREVGEAGWAVSPDARQVAVSHDGVVHLYVMDSGESRVLSTGSAQFTVVGWTDGGIIVADNAQALGTLRRLSPATGRLDAWVSIRPSDPSGVMNIALGDFKVTPDGRGYGYSWHRAISDLFLVEGWV